MTTKARNTRIKLCGLYKDFIDPDIYIRYYSAGANSASAYSDGSLHHLKRVHLLKQNLTYDGNTFENVFR